MNYKDKVIAILHESGVCAGEVDCMLIRDKVAQEKLYCVIYRDEATGKMKTIGKALYPVKAWRKAFEKLSK